MPSFSSSFSIRSFGFPFVPRYYLHCNLLHFTALHCSRAFPPSSHQSLLIAPLSRLNSTYLTLATQGFVSSHIVIHRLPAQIRYLTDGRARFNFLCWTILPGAIALAASSCTVPCPGLTGFQPRRATRANILQLSNKDSPWRQHSTISIETDSSASYSSTVALLHCAAVADLHCTLLHPPYRTTALACPTLLTIRPLLALHVSLPTTLPCCYYSIAASLRNSFSLKSSSHLSDPLRRSLCGVSQPIREIPSWFRSLDSAALLFVSLPRFDPETIRHDIHCKCTTQTSIISVISPCLVLSLLCFVLPACLYNHMPIPATSDVAPSILRAASSALHVPVQPTPWSTRASHAMHSLHMVDILSQNIPVNHNCFPPSAFISLRIGISLPLLSALSVLLGPDISGTFPKIWILPTMTPYTHLFFYHMSKFHPIP